MCFVRKVPTKQNCFEDRNASPLNSNPQNMHSMQISDAILDAMFNKLPYEYEFENLVNISPLKCALKSFTLALVFCCTTFFSICCIILKTMHGTCESKNPASFVRALEK